MGVSQQQWYPKSRHFDDKMTPTLPKWQPAPQPPMLSQQPVKSDNPNDSSSSSAAAAASAAVTAVWDCWVWAFMVFRLPWPAWRTFYFSVLCCCPKAAC